MAAPTNPAETPARLWVDAKQRALLLREFEASIETIGFAYEKANGCESDPYDAANDGWYALVVRARDNLADDSGAPWALEGSRNELDAILAGLRAESLFGLEEFPDVTAADVWMADGRLDVIVVCDALLTDLAVLPD